MSYFTALSLLFVGLKLTDYIDWSWWFVLMPLYMPVVIMFLITITIGVRKK